MSTDTEALLRLQGIGKRFADGTVGLADIDLTLPRGQFCVLLGASGAGKSTLLRVINGLLAPTEGSVWLDGERLPHGRPRRRRGRMATIHQGVDLVPRLSVLGNVLTGAIGEMRAPVALLGGFGHARKRRACALLREVALEPGQLYRRASTLSGGQQQRVGIARAFMGAPLLVLADEPVASLDPHISADILALLQRAAREHGATVLCSLHQVELARRFADRLVGMRGGRIVFDSAMDALDEAALGALYGGALAREAA